jgi:threonine/homoserine/homoserine lactone efflux protein
MAMQPTFFLQGMLIGFSIAAPVGPIGILCIQRTLNHGLRTGLLSGLGAATADAGYGCIAAFSVTALLGTLTGLSGPFRLIGGAYLCYLGWRAFRTPPAARMSSGQISGELRAYLSTLVLTATNPMTILSFAAIFAGFGIGRRGIEYLPGAMMVAGVFLGSTLWWLLLSGGTALIRRRLNRDHLRWVNRLSGLFIIAMGLFVLTGLLA